MLLMHRCFCSSCLFDLLIIMEIMEYFLAIYSVLHIILITNRMFPVCVSVFILIITQLDIHVSKHCRVKTS